MSRDPIDFAELGFASLAVRAGQHRTGEREQSEPIFLTSSFVFDDAAQAAAVFAEQEEGYVYSRYTNPTVRAFEQRLAALEGAEAGVGFASGMSAIFSLCLALLEPGDHILASRSLFGTTLGLFNNYLSRLGIHTDYADLADLDSWRQGLGPNTRLLFLETPSNPLGTVADLAALSELARKAGALLVVDNCFCTPALMRPLQLGADLVVHSATKYLDGQGRCLGGAVCGSAEHAAELVKFLRTCGTTMSAFNAWVFLKGLETLQVRMRAHSHNAGCLARWLVEQPGVAKVHYCGLPEHPQHAIAARQQSDFGGVLAFEVPGGRAAAWRVMDATRLPSITANLGDAKTTVTHPATTTHGRMSDAQRAAAGIGEGLIRVAVGLEDVEDVQADLARALAAVS